MDYLSLAHDVIRHALLKGASQAEIYLEYGDTFSVDVRRGAVETLRQAHAKGLGLRVLVGKKMGLAGTNDFSALESLTDEVIRAARASDDDDTNTFSETPIAARDGLRIYDPKIKSLSTDEKIQLARTLEQKTFEQDPRIHETEGAVFFSKIGSVVFANSHGLSAQYASTLTGMSVAPVAGDNGNKTSGYWQTRHRFFDSLDSIEQVASTAANRTVCMLGARKIKTTRAPVVFDPTAASDFLSAFFSAVNGDNINRGLSFLTDPPPAKIASEKLTIVDDGNLSGLTGSRPFDGEGIVPEKTVIVENGILRNFLYDIKAARRAGAPPTGNAGRRYDCAPWIAPNNFYIARGADAPEEIIRAMPRGLVVMNMMGFGFDTASGTFSFGAEGMWAENGEACFPVHEITIAANMKAMLHNIEAVGNDLEFRGSFSSPTLKIADMTISGN